MQASPTPRITSVRPAERQDLTPLLDAASVVPCMTPWTTWPLTAQNAVSLGRKQKPPYALHAKKPTQLRFYRHRMPYGISLPIVASVGTPSRKAALGQSSALNAMNLTFQGISAQSTLGRVRLPFHAPDAMQIARMNWLSALSAATAKTRMWLGTSAMPDASRIQDPMTSAPGQDPCQWRQWAS